MLSICIPIYNFDCTGLVASLVSQVEECKNKVELIVIDDASNEEFRELLKALTEKVRFFQLTENIGRSRIRNLLAEKARFKNILFIDGDSSIINNKFVLNYLTVLEKETVAKVFCGGSIYSDNAPSNQQMLRWKYSKARERKSLAFSQKHPYRSFTTNNFIIDKETFMEIKFDERIEEYGHEDTLFGYQLMKQKIPILHLENVVLNGDIDSNAKYLEKTQESISNLLKIAQLLEFKEDFVELIPLLKIYFRIKLIGLEILLRMWFRFSKKRLEKKFTKGKVSLVAFDFYRLGLLSNFFKKIRR